MYAKFVLNDSISETYDERYLIEGIGYWLTQTYTQPSQLNSNVFNIGQCVMTGDAPTAGIYEYVSHSYGSSDGWMRIRKNHYALGNSHGNIFELLTDTTWGWRVAGWDTNRQNGLPYNTSSMTSGGYTNASYMYGRLGRYVYNMKEVHVVATDYAVFIQAITDGTYTQADYGTYILSDLEYLPSYDDYAYAGNYRSQPQVHLMSTYLNQMENEGTAVGNNEFFNTIFRIQYMDQYGTYRQPSISPQSQYHYGGLFGNNTYPTVFPPPCQSVYQYPIDSGNYGHHLTPVRYQGHQSNDAGQGDPREGVMLDVYRTSNNLGSSGDLITDGSNNYRIFKVNKTGHSSTSSAKYSAVYAIRESHNKPA